MQQLQVAPLQLNYFQLAMSIVLEGRVDLCLRRYAGNSYMVVVDPISLSHWQ
jgi:hypothetical protein